MLVGDVVVLRAEDREPMLGQVIEHGLGTGARRLGTGVLIGVVGEDGVLQRTLGRPFASASVKPASSTPDRVGAAAGRTALTSCRGEWTSVVREQPAGVRHAVAEERRH